MAFDLIEHLHRQKAWSLKTFGPGTREKGVLDHIRKELKEIEQNSDDIMEWADLILLALDGVWRRGYTPDQIVGALAAKLSINEEREWPDWREADPNKAIEHVKDSAPSLFPRQPKSRAYDR